jgi:hypothetical protein
MSAVPALRKGREERGTLDRDKTKQAEGQATPPTRQAVRGIRRVSRRAYRLYWRIDYETLKSKNADTENISSRKRSRFPPFEKRKGWAPSVVVIPAWKGWATRPTEHLRELCFFCGNIDENGAK